MTTATTLILSPAPAIPGVAHVVTSADGVTVALWLDSNPLDPDWSWPASVHDAGASTVLIVAAGSLGPDLDSAHPANWMGAGRQRLDDWCASTRQDFPGRTVWLVPDARQVLSDVPSSLTFLRDQPDDRIGLALAAARLLEPAMLDVAEDHLTRIFEALGPRVAGVIVEDVVVDADRDRCVPVPPGRGVLPAAHLEMLLATTVPPTTPRIAAIE